VPTAKAFRQLSSMDSNGRPVFKDPKKKSHRIMPLHPSATVALVWWKAKGWKEFVGRRHDALFHPASTHLRYPVGDTPVPTQAQTGKRKGRPREVPAEALAAERRGSGKGVPRCDVSREVEGGGAHAAAGSCGGRLHVRAVTEHETAAKILDSLARTRAPPRAA
jgi:hypothetical protein